MYFEELKPTPPTPGLCQKTFLTWLLISLSALTPILSDTLLGMDNFSPRKLFHADYHSMAHDFDDLGPGTLPSRTVVASEKCCTAFVHANLIILDI